MIKRWMTCWNTVVIETEYCINSVQERDLVNTRNEIGRDIDGNRSQPKSGASDGNENDLLWLNEVRDPIERPWRLEVASVIWGTRWGHPPWWDPLPTPTPGSNQTGSTVTWSNGAATRSFSPPPLHVPIWSHFRPLVTNRFKDNNSNSSKCSSLDTSQTFLYLKSFVHKEDHSQCGWLRHAF